MIAAAFSMRRIEGWIASPLVGWATDKYGPRPVIFLGGLILGSGFILMIFVESLILFYVVYGVIISMGMSTCLYLPNMTAISHWFVRKNSRALSLLTVGAGFGGVPVCPALRAEYFDRTAFAKIGGFMSPIIMIGSFTGPIIAGYVFDHSGTYRTIFLALIILQCFASMVMYFACPSAPSQRVALKT
jgi:MFS family permease